MQNTMESMKLILVNNRITLKANGNQSSAGLQKKSTWELPQRIIKGLRQNFGKSESLLTFLEKRLLMILLKSNIREGSHIHMSTNFAKTSQHHPHVIHSLFLEISTKLLSEFNMLNSNINYYFVSFSKIKPQPNLSFCYLLRNIST